MNAEAAEKKRWAPDEYLAWERASEQKHELFRGEVFAMAGASREHNLLVANIVRAFGNALLKRPCEVYPSDLRVKVSVTGLYTYPDASIACDGPQFEDDRKDTLLNPKAILEVLSESTESYDRGRKFDQYRTLASLRDYVLVSQTEVLVEHFTRRPDETWLLRVLRAGSTLRLEGVECEVSTDELYSKVFG